jgi:Ca2+-binding RTX toxin-like protein
MAYIIGLNTSDTLFGIAGTDTFDAGLGNDTISYISSTSTVVSVLWQNLTNNDGFGTQDTLLNIENLIGGSSHDFLVGSFYANRIEGGAGNDVIYSLNGDDTLIGGIGADWLYGGADTDTIDYSASTANVVSVLWLNSTLNDGSSAVDTLDSIENLIGGQSYDFLVGSFYANRIEGGAGNDVIYSINGDDTLMGGQGADWLYGGDNTDTADYSSSTASVVSELWRNSTSNDGFGTVDTLDSIENLIGGSANDTLVGDFYANRIDAGAGDDKLYGLSGADTLNGGLGIDTADYSASTATVVADLRSTTSNDGFGSADTLISIENLIGGSAADYLVGDVVANKLEGNAGNDYLYGLDGNDTLIGGLGNDSLNGGVGSDTLAGGLDNDTYVVDESSDVVIENSSEGIDTVQATSSYILGANIENLILLGLADFTLGSGNADNNIITGSVSNNILNGSLGNDTLIGGLGADVFVFDALGATNYDVISDFASGQDKIDLSGATFLPALSFGIYTDMFVLGTSALDTNDYIIYNKETGELFFDADANGAGAQQLIAKLAPITNLLQSDFVNASPIAQPVATGLTLIGTALADSLIGGTGNDSLTGLDGNDTLNGGLGADTMEGGAGNDTYIVDSLSESVFENANEGNDTIIFAYNNLDARIELSANNNIENITITGTGLYSIRGDFGSNILTGNAFDNVIYGEAYELFVLHGGNDSLYGGAGIDWLYDPFGDNYLDGGVGADTMEGGGGHDTYIIDNIGDVVRDLGGNVINTVYSSINLDSANFQYQFYADIILTGSANINAKGFANITGNSGNNNLEGMQNGYQPYGNLTGYYDVLIGGAGNDTYTIDAGDIIIELAGQGIDTVITNMPGLPNGSYVLGDNLENLVVNYSGTGNALNNVITGGINGDSLFGMAGDDTLNGGAGNDSIYAGADNDLLNGGEGTDFMDGSGGGDLYIISSSSEHIAGEIQDSGLYPLDVDELRFTSTVAGQTLTLFALDSGFETVVIGTGTSIMADTSSTIALNVDSSAVLAGTLTITGNAGNNILTGNQAWNTFNGGAGNDTLDGGAGNDSLNGGTGNDSLIGGVGSDTLDGGTGIDTLVGGAGSDTYLNPTASTIITENANEGIDSISTNSASFSLLDANLESLTYTGAGNFTGTGNASDNSLISGIGNDTLIGGDGNDTLDGGAGNDSLTGGIGNDWMIAGTGADTMIGGAGSDNYDVDNIGDTIFENASEGGDTAWVTVLTSYTLALNVESMRFFGLVGTLTGNASDNFISNVDAGFTGTMNGGDGNDTLNGSYGLYGKQLNGDAGDDYIIGGIGADSLYGGQGNDFLVGDLGADIFDFNFITESVIGVNHDVIFDFNSTQLDKIDLSAIDADTTIAGNQGFTFMGVNAAFGNAAGQLRFVSASNSLFGDVNGDSVADFEIALNGVTALTSSDFIL